LLWNRMPSLSHSTVTTGARLWPFFTHPCTESLATNRIMQSRPFRDANQVKFSNESLHFDRWVDVGSEETIEDPNEQCVLHIASRPKLPKSERSIHPPPTQKSDRLYWDLGFSILANDDPFGKHNAEGKRHDKDWCSNSNPCPSQPAMSKLENRCQGVSRQPFVDIPGWNDGQREQEKQQHGSYGLQTAHGKPRQSRATTRDDASQRHPYVSASTS